MKPLTREWIEKAEGDFASAQREVRALNVFAKEVRYPGQSADNEMTRQAAAICKDIRKSVRQRLRLRL